MKVGIFSLGLIGGSLLKALAGKGIELVGVTRNIQTIEKAKKYCVSCSDDINLLKDWLLHIYHIYAPLYRP